MKELAKGVLISLAVSATCWAAMGLGELTLGSTRTHVWPSTSPYILPNLAAIFGWTFLGAALLLTGTLILKTAIKEK